MNNTEATSFEAGRPFMIRLEAWLPYWYTGTTSGASVLIAIVSVLVLAVITRVRSGRQSNKASASGDATAVAYMPPYWIPVLGHLFDLIFRSESLFRQLR